MLPPPQIDDERLMRRYLLGELGEEESDRLQAVYFTDKRFFDHLLSVEDDLVDSYVRGELPEAERARFEQRLLNTRGQRHRVDCARLLERAASDRPAVVASKPSYETSWWRSIHEWLSNLNNPRIFSFGAVALVAVVICVALFVMHYSSERSSGLMNQQAAVVAPQQPIAEPTPVMDGAHQPPAQSYGQPETNTRSTPGQNSAGIAQVKRVTPAHLDARARKSNSRQTQTTHSAGIASLMLTTGLVRDGGKTTQLIVTPRTQWAELHLEVTDTNHTPYRAVVQTVEGTEVYQQSLRRVRAGRAGRFIDLRVPAALLTKKDYVVLLQSETPDGAPKILGGYSFVVVRK